MCEPVTVGCAIAFWSPPEAAVLAASPTAFPLAAAMVQAGAAGSPVVRAATGCRMAKAPRAGAGLEAHKRQAAPAGQVVPKSSIVAPLAVPDRMGRSVSVEAAGWLRTMGAEHTPKVAEVAAEATSAVVGAGALVTYTLGM